MPRLGFGPPLIYLVGGREQGEGTGSTVWAFDPALDTYCEVSSMATRRHTRGHGAAALGGKLYVMGGFDDLGFDDEVPLAQAEVYDPKADDWQLLPSMLMPRRSFAAAAVAGKVYAIGGAGVVINELGFNSLSDAVEAYDPISDAWTQVASLPMPRGEHTATVIDGKIYVLGGSVRADPDDDDEKDGWAGTSDMVVYDPATDSWQQWKVAHWPSGKYGHSAAVLNGKIYVTGGVKDDYVTGDALEAHDPVAGTWTTLASMRQGRELHNSAVVNGKLYVFGGHVSNSYASLDVEVYSPASNSWARAADLPFGKSPNITAVALRVNS